MITIQSFYTQQLKQFKSSYTKTVESYTASLRAALSILYNSNDFSGFVESMQLAIEQNLTAAWIAGAASCGISQDEISDAEVSRLFGLILRDFSFIAGFGADVVAGRAEGKSISSFFPRLNIWANRWEQTKAIAQSMSCGDQKLRWQLGVADHCSSCLQLSGKVKRASDWAAAGIYPKMSTLACGGFNCKCTFVPTNAPLTAGSIAPSLSTLGLVGGGIALAGAAVAAGRRARPGVAQLASAISVGDESINLKIGHGIKFGDTVTITEAGNTYIGVAFAIAPNVVEVNPPVDFSFSINATVTIQ